MLGNGYKTVNFIIELNVAEKDDGWQYLLLFSSAVKSNTYLLQGVQFEHGSGIKDTSWWVHELNFYDIDITKFSNNEFIIRYGADGDFEDTWYNKELKIKLIFNK